MIFEAEWFLVSRYFSDKENGYHSTNRLYCDEMFNERFELPIPEEDEEYVCLCYSVFEGIYKLIIRQGEAVEGDERETKSVYVYKLDTVCYDREGEFADERLVRAAAAFVKACCCMNDYIEVDEETILYLMLKLGKFIPDTLKKAVVFTETEKDVPNSIYFSDNIKAEVPEEIYFTYAEFALSNTEKAAEHFEFEVEESIKRGWFREMFEEALYEAVRKTEAELPKELRAENGAENNDSDSEELVRLFAESFWHHASYKQVIRLYKRLRDFPRNRFERDSALIAPAEGTRSYELFESMKALLTNSDTEKKGLMLTLLYLRGEAERMDFAEEGVNFEKCIAENAHVFKSSSRTKKSGFYKFVKRFKRFFGNRPRFNIILL